MAVGAGVGQRADDVQVLRDRAGPAVGQDQRQRVRLRRPDVQEVDVLAVDVGEVLGMLVEPRFEGTPVVAVAPVFDRAVYEVQAGAVVRALAGDVAGPAGPVQALLEVVQAFLADRDSKGTDVLGRGAYAAHGARAARAARAASAARAARAARAAHGETPFRRGW